MSKLLLGDGVGRILLGDGSFLLLDDVEPPASAVVGGGFANWSKKQDKAREKAWEAARNAQEDLRTSLEELASGRPKKAKEAVRTADKKLEQAATAIAPIDNAAFDTLLEMRADIERLIQGTLQAAKVRDLIEQIEIAMEDEADEDAAMIALLMTV